MQRLLEEVGCQTREYEWPDYWYFGDERSLIKDGEKVECFTSPKQIRYPVSAASHH